MPTVIPSGLGATLGFASETTVGTFVAPNRWPQFDKEGLSLKKKVVQSAGLHGGLYELAARRAYTTRSADGPVDLDVTDRQMGLLFQQSLGSTAPVITTPVAGATSMVFAPGDTTGMAMSVQVGRPTTAGAIQAFSYPGCKVTDWELSVAVDQIAKLALTLDSWDEVTAEAYAAASYVDTNVLHFAEGNLLLGGTLTTTAGVTTVAGATALPVVTSASIKGANALNTNRYFLGADGKKAEQLADGWRKLTGSIEAEFENLTDAYEAFAADTATALELTFTGQPIGATAINASLSILVPNIHWEEGPPHADGPAVLSQKLSFTGLDDGTNNPVQITYVTADTAP
jgi:hypothetical protein